jgi:hypothetical protein
MQTPWEKRTDGKDIGISIYYNYDRNGNGNEHENEIGIENENDHGIRIGFIQWFCFLTFVAIVHFRGLWFIPLWTEIHKKIGIYEDCRDWRSFDFLYVENANKFQSISTIFLMISLLLIISHQSFLSHQQLKISIMLMWWNSNVSLNYSKIILILTKWIRLWKYISELQSTRFHPISFKITQCHSQSLKIIRALLLLIMATHFSSNVIALDHYWSFLLSWWHFESFLIIPAVVVILLIIFDYFWWFI